MIVFIQIILLYIQNAILNELLNSIKVGLILQVCLLIYGKVLIEGLRSGWL